MKYMGMPAGMWALYKRSFTKAMVTELGFSASQSAEIMRNAKPKYREIIGKLPEFEKADRIKMNIVGWWNYNRKMRHGGQMGLC